MNERQELIDLLERARDGLSACDVKSIIIEAIELLESEPNSGMDCTHTKEDQIKLLKESELCPQCMVTRIKTLVNIVNRQSTEKDLIFKRMGHEAERAAKLDVKVEDLTAYHKAKDDDIKKLKEFARFVIRTNCWNLPTLDGGSIHDKAEELGLVKVHTATKEDLIDIVIDDLDIGDTIFRFTDILRKE